MLTQLGKMLRKERIERNWTMGGMAKALEISPAYLSHIEMGRRPASKKHLDKICSLLEYNDIEAQKLRNAADKSYSPETIKIHSKNLQEGDRDLAKMFARRFPNLSDEEKEKMFEILVSEGVKEDE